MPTLSGAVGLRRPALDSSLWGGGGLLWAGAMLEDLRRVLEEDARRREDAASAPAA